MAFPSLSDYKRYIEENGTNKAAVTDTSKTTRQAPAAYQDSAGYVKNRIAKAGLFLSRKTLHHTEKHPQNPPFRMISARFLPLTMP